jgi:type IV pilus biogenesis protein CpaD/CtpE
MGARLYNPTTGHFTSRDPVTGGNTTSYTYPQDPINLRDVDGLVAVAVAAGAAAAGLGITVRALLAVVGAAAIAYLLIRVSQRGWSRTISDIRVLYRSYSQHGRDRSSQRGISRDMIEQTIRTGRRIRGNKPGTTKYVGRKIWVVINNQNGKVVSMGRN